jgi:hypothetical protein
MVKRLKQPAKPQRPSADSADTDTSGLHAFSRTPAVGAADILESGKLRDILMLFCAIPNASFSDEKSSLFG